MIYLFIFNTIKAFKDVSEKGEALFYNNVTGVRTRVGASKDLELLKQFTSLLILIKQIANTQQNTLKTMQNTLLSNNSTYRKSDYNGIRIISVSDLYKISAQKHFSQVQIICINIPSRRNIPRIKF